MASMTSTGAPIDHNLRPQDLDAFFMPFTPQRQYKQDPRIIVSARGMYYTDSRGHETLDASAGLWCVNAGHYRTHINQAIAAQLEQL
ncbi:MAG: aspartate aminotransferase family protein, partial [Pseudomonadales bacterium]